MSKIQKALQRLQSRGAPANSPRMQAEDARSLSIAVGRAGRPEDAVEQTVVTHGVVIQFDQEALRDAGLIAPDNHVQMLADQYRDIKRPIIANAFGRRVTKVDDGNLIMISSAVAGEGKTFTSINLAISIAQEKDLNVLLVDADVAKPHISNVLGVSEMPGLLDILQNEDNSLVPEALIVPTDIKGLSILPAGLPRAHATELLSSFKMEKLTKDLAARSLHRFIIFDTPPLTQTSEAKALANFAGQVVLVVQAETTPQNAVSEALDILGLDKAVNLVLNQSRMDTDASEYGYGYGYSYGLGKSK